MLCWQFQQDPSNRQSFNKSRSVCQHLYLRQQQLHIRQDAQHPADEEGQREERQERDQERERCEILQDWRQIPRQSWVDCKYLMNCFISPQKHMW